MSTTLMLVDWHSVFVPELSLIEIVIRGTIIYLMLFFLLRIFRREAGAIGIADLLFVVLIADAAQNALGSDYKSVTEGIVLVCTIVFWNHALDWIAYRFPRLQRLIRAAPTPLVKDGKILPHNMRQELISREELTSLLREQGVEDVKEVKSCRLEGDGRISVVKFSQDESQRPSQQSVGQR